MIIANWIALILLLIGGLNWGLVGLFSFNLVSWMFQKIMILARIVYILVALSAIWLIISAAINGGIFFVM